MLSKVRRGFPVKADNSVMRDFGDFEIERLAFVPDLD
jgi:hypothetical protein